MKTAEQEKLEGNPGRRPEKKNMPIADKKILGPPRWLDSISKRAYHELVALMGEEGMRVLAASDRLALILICEAYEEFRKCRALLQKEDRYYTSINNEAITIKKHPAVGDMQNAWTRIMTGLGKFGMTPYERQKVSVVIGDEEPKQTREQEMAERRQKAIDAAKSKPHLQAVNE